MPDHCRECRAMRNLGTCDCDGLLIGRDGYDAVAKPLLASALGAKWLGMEDMATEEWRPVRVVKIDREIASEEEHERTLKRDISEVQERLRHLRTERAKEMNHDASGE